jgi:hypothetical protein
LQNHFKTKEKHKEAKDKTSTGQDVGKAGRTTKKRGKEGGGRERSGRSCSERMWGEQGGYFSTTPKERQTNGERKAQSANREQRRTKRVLKDY